MTRVGLLIFLLVSSGASQAQDDPDYPLGKLGLPPMTEPAEPLRLVDLELAFTENRSTVSSFEARLKLGASVFFGGEVRGERVGAFFDTQRLELGASEEDGGLDLEGSYRGSFFLVGLDAERRRDDSWKFVGNGSLRLSSDWELLLRYEHDSDHSRDGIPSARSRRVVRSGSLGFLYQHENNLELAGEASVSRVRTEAGFDQTRERAGASGIWNVSNLEIDGRVFVHRLTGRLARTEALAELGVAVRFAGHFVASARTLQEWQPGVLRFVRDYRGGLTFFGRRFRFARSSELAEEVLRLARRANELGYNERRVYDIDGLRAFRERLSISPARAALASDIDALYLAQVRERNVPQVGFELATTMDEIAGSAVDDYRLFVGVPWRVAWPFTRGEERVEFLRADWVRRVERFPSLNWESHAYEISVSAELNRQHILRFRLEKPAQTPEELAFRIRRGRTIRAEYVYALGR